jgi:hypothetical protein
MEEIYPKWKGKPVVPSYHAAREMEGRFTLDDVVEILERGYDCSKSKRARVTIEKCIRKKGKIIRIVAVEAYSTWIGGSVWLIKHIG